MNRDDDGPRSALGFLFTMAACLATLYLLAAVLP